MKKILTLILCSVISLVIFSGCGEDKKSNVIPMEQLEYGATMRQLLDTEIEICFDGRFFTDEEMKAISSYYYSIQTKDKELFMSTQSAPYVEYVEKNTGASVDSFITSIYEGSVASLGEGFEYVYIEATACGDRTDDLEIDEITNLMNEIYKESGKSETFEKTVTSAKYAMLDFTAENNGEQFTLTDQRAYIFTCTDGIYIYTLN